MLNQLLLQATYQIPASLAVEGAEATSNKPKDPPVQIGFKRFDSAEAALKYFYDLVKCLRREQDINEVRKLMASHTCKFPSSRNLVLH